MTTRANSQFPRPDFHRQDRQPYGLRATVRESSPKKLCRRALRSGRLVQRPKSLRIVGIHLEKLSNDPLRDLSRCLLAHAAPPLRAYSHSQYAQPSPPNTTAGGAFSTAVPAPPLSA